MLSARAGIGKSLNPTGQQFFMENWRKIADFIETPEGQTAVGEFMNAWTTSLQPKSFTEEKEPPQQPET